MVKVMPRADRVPLGILVPGDFKSPDKFAPEYYICRKYFLIKSEIINTSHDTSDSREQNSKYSEEVDL